MKKFRIEFFDDVYGTHWMGTFYRDFEDKASAIEWAQNTGISEYFEIMGVKQKRILFQTQVNPQFFKEGFKC